MTITEFMNDLEMESTEVATEMACTSFLCDIYSTEEIYPRDTLAIENVSLTFDDDDDYGTSSYQSPAIEGFFGELKSKFSGVTSTVKAWFDKIAKAIKEWVAHLAQKFKDAVAHAKARQSAQTMAGARADIKSAEDDYARDKAYYQKQLDEARKQLADTDAKNSAAKSANLNNKIAQLEKKLRELEETRDSRKNAAIKTIAAQYSKDINTAFVKVKSAFDMAVANEEALFKSFGTFMNSSTGTQNDSPTLASIAGGGRAVDGDKLTKDNLNNVNKERAQGLLDKMEKLAEKVNETQRDADEAVKKAEEAGKKLYENDKGELSAVMKQTILSNVQLSFGFDAMEKRARQMASDCDKLSATTTKLAQLFAKDENGNDIADKDKPTVAKLLSKYSAVASDISKIANNFMKMGNSAFRAMLVKAAKDAGQW